MPYTRVALDRFQPGAGDQVLARVQHGLLPLLRQQPGFVAYEVVRTGEDSAIFIHTSETQQQAEASVQTATAWVRENLAGLIAAVETHVGELVVTSRD
jgi:quinol monooxygenase YgiN